ncbi:hypothetical protein DYB32_007594 [Aphanomyces invadans]|uniref:Uncharacterized protein n=1 Tax=Aphanomyces invadans TaxID=157072 RepID=A0A418ANG2_9STRA|nr:hypothetical protein DYB32_007594 [Aphanomyces invadans]
MLLRSISSAILAFGYVHAVSVTVYRNGESTGGVAVEVLPQHVPSGQALAAYLSDFVDVDGIIVQAEDGKEQGKIIADRVVTGKGVHVHAYDDLHDDDKLYLVPPDFHFVWPYVEVSFHQLYLILSMADGLQLLRYQQKQAYIPHDDYFEIGSKVDSDWNFNPKTGGSNRLASYPQKAHAVLFYSQKGNGERIQIDPFAVWVNFNMEYYVAAELDPMAEHGGCPVLEGTKWYVCLIRHHVHDDERSFRLNGESGPIGTTFANDMDIPLDLYWESNLMATLAPHKSIYYTSYAGHAWSFKDPASGNVVRELKLKETDSDTQRIVATGVPAPTLPPHPVDEL